MDVDNDVDQGLLQQFRCMGTTDREVLIAQLQKLIGNHLNERAATFFLDMNNWNLQDAVCSYFDFESPHRLPKMAFISDVTIGEGESVPPNTGFVKTWRVRNSGDEQWPPGCCLRYTQGFKFTHQDRVLVEDLQPGHQTDISVEMMSPADPGIYQAKWRMSTSTGTFFGEVIWVILTVAEGGTMAVTQQMSHLSELGSPPLQTVQLANPFASPQQPSLNASRSLFQQSLPHPEGDQNTLC